MTAHLPTSWHEPLAAPPRDRYGDDILAATDTIVAAAHRRDPETLQAAVDRALALRQPAGEDPVTWLVAALAAQVDPSVPLERRLPWAAPVRGVGGVS